MNKKTIAKKMEVSAMGTSYEKGYWTLIVGLVFAALCVVQIETSRAKSRDFTDLSKITVERLPASEARTLGVDIRNH